MTKKILIFIWIFMILFCSLSFSQAKMVRNNTRLEVMRLNEVGISPAFSPDVKKYYFIASANMTDLEVTAIPENPNATVTITGNTDLKMGKNEIKITVESEDKTAEDTYTIYVTRTESEEKANANLETLAVRNVMLSPEFDAQITNYAVEVENDVSTLDVLAIAQKEDADVTVTGNKEIYEGNNTILVNVLAEDGITSKEYRIDVYKRNKEEQIKYEENKEVEAERLSAILYEENNNANGVDNRNVDNINIEDREENKSNVMIAFGVLVMVLIVIFGGIYLGRNSFRKK